MGSAQLVISLRTYLILLAALAVERLYELTIARRNARAGIARGAIEVGGGHYGVMVALHVLFLVSCALEAVTLAALPRPFVQWSALSAALLAQALRYWAISTLGDRWNTRIIVLPDSSPVTRGPYRFIRHPNYVAVVIEMFVVPAIAGCWFTAMGFSIANAILLAVRIRTEERALGETYARAFSARPRFIPGVRGA
ncbi:MAG: isoprenylcysteine carboxyl methyltransferase family protein [Candidatus Binataceae bacterium]